MAWTNEQQLIELHDKAAREATGWRRLQGFREELRAELVPAAPHPERLDAIAAYETVMNGLRAREAEARGRMMRLRERIGRSPPRRMLRASPG